MVRFSYPSQDGATTRRTLVKGITSDGSTEGKRANDVGPGRTSGDG